jgi:hypothetical protein
MKETLNSRVAVVETKIEAINTNLDLLRADIKEVHSCLHETRDLILTEIKALRFEENEEVEAHEKNPQEQPV